VTDVGSVVAFWLQL